MSREMFAVFLFFLFFLFVLVLAITANLVSTGHVPSWSVLAVFGALMVPLTIAVTRVKG